MPVPLVVGVTFDGFLSLLQAALCLHSMDPVQVHTVSGMGACVLEFLCSCELELFRPDLQRCLRACTRRYPTKEK